MAIVFNVVFNGWGLTMTKKKTAGFTVTGKVKRSDFNLGGTPLETGVSNEIALWANVEIGKIKPVTHGMVRPCI
jgi:polyisoprenoid-binding protein YceI